MSVRPRRELGQHWLVDQNILHVVGRLAALEAEDVVLEIGPGLGVLTAYLADRVSAVHAVEIDEALQATLREQLAGRENVHLVFGDALDLLDAGFDPPPGKLVANLPYNVATPIVAESLPALPSVERWCVLVQREVADRFFAAPGTKDYGAVSVVLQLAAERTGRHPVARSCFRPPPNVDSALVAFRRTRAWGADLERARRLAQAGFGHRRKTLVNSLELTGFADRASAAACLAELGRASDVRAEELAPGEFLRLAELVRA
jgi:16S rRNA (adenine1518-N6/adenine1519-N6)-dimethyltransferase